MGRFFAGVITVLLIASFGLGMLLHPLKASALTGSDFQAGHIIDDVIFTNASAMDHIGSSTPWDYIQNFLSSKVPSCDTNGSIQITYWYDPSNSYTSSSTPEQGGDSSQVTTSRQVYGAHYDVYHNTNIAATPYVCLSQYVENPNNGQNNLQNPGASITGGQTAAQIIYNAAHAYNINPEVLIVTLQKEQGLVTDDWPWLYEYTEAMGFNCPDSGGCSGFPGFYQQVTAAAAQYRNYLNNPNNFNYVVGNNPILFAPGCGSGPVNILNQATAALYDYTPYQPNSNVLTYTNATGSSSPGSVPFFDSCATYGNRNFWWYFNTWFGSSLTSGFAWQWQSQYAFTDAGKTTPVNLSNLQPGQRVYLGLTVKNVGSQTWLNSGPNPIMLGTDNPQERASIFSPGSGWLSPTRPALMKEASVAPGQTATFEFWITVPLTPGSGGTYNEHFNLIANNLTWFPGSGISYGITFPNPAYTWQWQSQYAFTDSGKTTPVNLANLQPGQKVYVGFTAKNTGNVTWSNSGSNAVKLGTDGPRERQSIFSPGSSWLSSTRPTAMKEATVAPGQTGTFEFWMTVPLSPSTGGSYNEHFNIVSEGITWFSGSGISYGITFPKPTYSWQWQSQYAFTDSGKTTPVSLNGLMPGSRVFVGFTVKNTGNVTWLNSGNNPMRVGTTNPLERTSLFQDNTWLGPSRPTAMKEASTAPGQTATFEFWLNVPNNPGMPGSYNEQFGMLSEGLTWLNNTLGFGINVTPKTYAWQWQSQYAFTDATKTTPVNLNGVARGSRVYVGFTAKNVGNVTWTNNGTNPVRVGTVAPRERTSLFQDSSWLSAHRPSAMTESSVAPGQTGTFEFWLTIPNTPGTYNERFGLVAENYAWFNDTGLTYGITVP